MTTAGPTKVLSSTICPAVVCPAPHTPQQRALPAKKSSWRPGQDEPAPVPGGLPWLRCFPFPCSHLGPSLGSLALLWVPQGAEPTGASTTRGKGWMHMPAPAAPRGDAFDITWVFRKFFSFGNPTLQKCNFLLDLPHAFERRHLTPASGHLLRAPWAFSEMSNPRRSPQHLQCFVTALAKC